MCNQATTGGGYAPLTFSQIWNLPLLFLWTQMFQSQNRSYAHDYLDSTI